jgi:YD repeat-containing protein
VVTDPRGHPTTSRFTPDGFPREVTDALGQTTTFERQPGTNLLLSTTDPLGRVTRFAYDANGNVTTITDPLNNTRTISYDPTFNKVTSITDPEQNLKPPAQRLKTQIAYNAFGQPISTTDPLGNTIMGDVMGDLGSKTT